VITNKKIIVLLVLVLCFNFLLPLAISYAAPLDNIAHTLGASTVSSDSSSGGGLINSIFGFLYDKIIGPLLHLGSGPSKSTSPATVPLPTNSSSSASSGIDSDALKGKVIIVDPGHGGSNPGAVGNNTRESDNNLAVALKLQDKLTRSGAKVIMTRSSDRTVAAEGSTLTQELAARVDLAEANHADMFISLHSNENTDTSIQGATTYYHSDQSVNLAKAVQNSLIAVTGATDKGISQDNFYVIRTPTMPSVLVEMGFVSNPGEAKKLNTDAYRDQLAAGISKGISQYFNQK
jgi:N-acetylmuramoyl-L-alanine amidase